MAGVPSTHLGKCAADPSVSLDSNLRARGKFRSLGKIIQETDNRHHLITPEMPIRTNSHLPLAELAGQKRNNKFLKQPLHSYSAVPYQRESKALYTSHINLHLRVYDVRSIVNQPDGTVLMHKPSAPFELGPCSLPEVVSLRSVS